MSRPQSALEFERARTTCGMSVAEAAAYLGLCERTIQRYESGETRASPVAIKWLQEHAAQLAALHSKSAEFTFIDLFAGIGGLRKGFEHIGGKCIFTCEWDQYSRKTYKENYSVDHEFGGDIREFAAQPERIPKHDVLLAGFPCQPFSIAGVSKKNALGRPHGFLCDTQGTLFFDLAQIIAHHKPAAFLLENVKNLERHDQGKTFATIMHVLRKELGYEVHTRVIGSEPWVPQKRERIFIVGFLRESRFDFDALSVPEGKRPMLGKILDPHNEVDPKYTLTAHLWGYLQDYKKKHEAKGNGFGYSVFGPKDVTRTLSARYYKDGSEVLIAQPRKRPRRLTPRECARLMGFDGPNENNFKIPVSDTQAYKQFGNAVVVPVVKAVAELMKPHIRSALGEVGTNSDVDQSLLDIRSHAA
ncbi:DNA (cytosine-5-)-methyltransferase [Terrarubrum flagellatum]|uniref:DNA (cytosine-5-)-methyltransferase n=1 Tax=Terrirubrum flagellatum TaxID=2895980 RepID=UPI0031454116